MAQIRQTLKLESDQTTEVFPNIKPENIPVSAIDETKIAIGAVTTSKIRALAVQTSNIADNAVTNSKIGSLAVQEGNIGTGAVTTTKILNDAVTNSKIANNAVTTTKIIDEAVTTSKIKHVDNYLADDDLGDNIDEFVTHFTALFKKGYRFYYDDENGNICSVDGIEIQNHSVTLFVSYPFQGMNQMQQIDSTNFSTYFSGTDYGTMLHYCGA